MCTVSFIYKGNSAFVLTSNRDESPMRVTHAPSIYDALDTKMIFPKDAIAGGTWIGTSDKKRVVCLLNGGFKNHARLPEYRHSRGVVVKDFLAATDITETVHRYNLNLIEPFTIVIVDWNETLQLFELVWDGAQKHFQKLPLTSHIWSSSTLYTEKMKEMRRDWFSKLKQEKTLNADTLLNFHKTAGINDPNVDVIMDRGIIKTISITQIEKTEDSIAMNYYDLTKNRHSVISFNPIEALHE
ncbi:NRDE family protein [Kordia sp. YSTF-M3]|uniref:NRDE family protein n=1 Tax=Kordia aestuariivivens TaxID=2759037 RepID=A0ABR7Q4I3_9FLAO|nr:NRDE family protein [Kordia aestuariivivens]MBC8753455.1 NRDE family protein [Kordia aestuariivivens]